MADRNAVLQKKAADLIDHSGPAADQAKSHAVKGLQIQLIAGLYRNAACRWPLHSFRDRVRIPEVILVTLTERFGISRWHLLYVMTECNQLTTHIMRRHAGLDTNQALRHIRKPLCNPTARDLFAQNNRSFVIQANQMQRVLACINANCAGDYSIRLPAGDVLLVLLSPARL